MFYYTEKQKHNMYDMWRYDMIVQISEEKNRNVSIEAMRHTVANIPIQSPLLLYSTFLLSLLPYHLSLLLPTLSLFFFPALSLLLLPYHLSLLLPYSLSLLPYTLIIRSAFSFKHPLLLLIDTNYTY